MEEWLTFSHQVNYYYVRTCQTTNENSRNDTCEPTNGIRHETFVKENSRGIYNAKRGGTRNWINAAMLHSIAAPAAQRKTFSIFEFKPPGIIPCMFAHTHIFVLHYLTRLWTFLNCSANCENFPFYCLVYLCKTSVENSTFLWLWGILWAMNFVHTQLAVV